jgi:hypothetical protein
MEAMNALEQWLALEPLGMNETAVVVDVDLTDCAFETATQHAADQPLPDNARLYSREVRLVGPIRIVGNISAIMQVICKVDSAWNGGGLGDDHVISVTMYWPGTQTKEVIGAFSPNSTYAGLTPTANKRDSLGAVGFLVAIAYMLVLINTPRFTTRAQLPRQTRRRIDRGTPEGASDRISVISWNLTKPKLEAGESLGSGRHMPLHYTRGHWRQCVAHLDRAHLHADGVHRMWIEGFWSGHPAYGIVRSIHAPKL